MLTRIFSDRIYISSIADTNIPLGTGIVNLVKSSDIQHAIHELSGNHLLGHKIFVRSLGKEEFSTYSSIADALSPPKTSYTSAAITVADASSKKKAQTELARQKMLALKSEKENPQNNVKTDKLLPQANEAFHIAQQEIPTVHYDTIEKSALTSMKSSQDAVSVSTSDKAKFSIPGLFMVPSVQEPSAPSDQLTCQNMDLMPQDNVQLSCSVQPSGNITNVVRPDSQVGVGKLREDASLLSVTSVLDAHSPANGSLASGSRKRQKAADFIDSPSVRIKRPLGLKEDTSVIIEVSEDEKNLESDLEDVAMDVEVEMDIDEETVQHTPPKDISAFSALNGKQNGIRDLPPLSDFPARKATTPNKLITSPPTAQAPSKSKEPEGLKIQIDIMNRKIAELNQLIKAKKTASRAQTPEKSGSIKPSPQAAKVLTTNQEKTKASISSTEARDISIIQSEPKEVTIPSESLEAVETVQVSDTVETVMTAEIMKATEQEQDLTKEHVEASKKARLDAENLISVEAARVAEDEQQSLRRAEIEAGLPILDAEMEKAKRKLESMRKQMEDLENEVQKGVEGRRILIEELMGLPPVSTSLHINAGQTSTQRDEIKHGKYLPASNDLFV